jgi:hypothetical protein
MVKTQGKQSDYCGKRKIQCSGPRLRLADEIQIHVKKIHALHSTRTDSTVELVRCQSFSVHSIY